MQIVTLNISGMTCMGCATSIKKVLEEISGVSEANISLEKKQAKIQYDPEKATIDQFENTILEAGFEVLK
tara:strand:- start:1831 stop:2040 length:210 start_codon:yes stop_codon:yes gene_type:complete